MAAPQASSRLEMLQARFQQRQLAEKEQKLLQLYDQQQMRAHQVAQRGSAGSNGSNSSSHGNSSNVSHHQTVTRTNTTTHSTSNSQGGGKVRQMFDERRQTNVKGIDKSYPLEPLDNRSRKHQTTVTSNVSVDTSSSQKNCIPVGNRRSIMSRRTVCSEASNNVNDGKAIVTYHEEVSNEINDSNDRHNQQEEFDDEHSQTFRYENGNQRTDRPTQLNIEDIANENTSQRYETTSKIHLAGLDRSNVTDRTNDNLKNKQFPDDEIIDAPKRLLRRSSAGKNTFQAETRFERPKNANVKKIGQTIKQNVAKPTSFTKKLKETAIRSGSTSRASTATVRMEEEISKASPASSDYEETKKSIYPSSGVSVNKERFPNPIAFQSPVIKSSNITKVSQLSHDNLNDFYPRRKSEFEKSKTFRKLQLELGESSPEPNEPEEVSSIIYGKSYRKRSSILDENIYSSERRSSSSSPIFDRVYPKERKMSREESPERPGSREESQNPNYRRKSITKSTVKKTSSGEIGTSTFESSSYSSKQRSSSSSQRFDRNFLEERQTSHERPVSRAGRQTPIYRKESNVKRDEKEETSGTSTTYLSRRRSSSSSPIIDHDFINRANKSKERSPEHSGSPKRTESPIYGRESTTKREEKKTSGGMKKSSFDSSTYSSRHRSTICNPVTDRHHPKERETDKESSYEGAEYPERCQSPAYGRQSVIKNEECKITSRPIDTSNFHVSGHNSRRRSSSSSPTRDSRVSKERKTSHEGSPIRPLSREEHEAPIYRRGSMTKSEERDTNYESSTYSSRQHSSSHSPIAHCDSSKERKTSSEMSHELPRSRGRSGSPCDRRNSIVTSEENKKRRENIETCHSKSGTLPFKHQSSFSLPVERATSRENSPEYSGTRKRTQSPTYRADSGNKVDEKTRSAKMNYNFASSTYSSRQHMVSSSPDVDRDCSEERKTSHEMSHDGLNSEERSQSPIYRTETSSTYSPRQHMITPPPMIVHDFSEERKTSHEMSHDRSNSRERSQSPIYRAGSVTKFDERKITSGDSNSNFATSTYSSRQHTISPPPMIPRDISEERRTSHECSNTRERSPSPKHQREPYRKYVEIKTTTGGSKTFDPRNDFSNSHLSSPKPIITYDVSKNQEEHEERLIIERAGSRRGSESPIHRGETIIKNEGTKTMSGNTSNFASSFYSSRRRSSSSEPIIDLRKQCECNNDHEHFVPGNRRKSGGNLRSFELIKKLVGSSDSAEKPLTRSVEGKITLADIELSDKPLNFRGSTKRTIAEHKIVKKEKACIEENTKQSRVVKTGEKTNTRDTRSRTVSPAPLRKMKEKTSFRVEQSERKTSGDAKKIASKNRQKIRNIGLTDKKNKDKYHSDIVPTIRSNKDSRRSSSEITIKRHDTFKVTRPSQNIVKIDAEKRSAKTEDSSYKKARDETKDKSQLLERIEKIRSTLSRSGRSEQNLPSQEYERTDSVESALKRFDSIGVETEHHVTVGVDEPDIHSRVASSELFYSSSNDKKKPVNEKIFVKKTIMPLCKSAAATGVVEQDRPKETERVKGKLSQRRGKNTEVMKTAESKKKKSTTMCTTPRHSDNKMVAKSREGQKRVTSMVKRSKLRGEESSGRGERNEIDDSPLCKRKLFVDSESEIENENSTSTIVVTSIMKMTGDNPETVEIETLRNRENVKTSFENFPRSKSPDGDSKVENEPTKVLRSIEDIRKSIKHESEDFKRELNKFNRAMREDTKNSSTKNADPIMTSGTLSRVQITKTFKSGDREPIVKIERTTVKLPITHRVAKSPSPDIGTKKSMEGRTKTTMNTVKKSIPSSPAKSSHTTNKYAASEIKISGANTVERPRSGARSREAENQKEFSTTTEYSDGTDSPGNNSQTNAEIVSTTIMEENNEARVVDYKDYDVSESKENASNQDEGAIGKRQSEGSLISRKQSDYRSSTTTTPLSRPTSALSTTSSSTSARGQSPRTNSKSKMSTSTKSSTSSGVRGSTNTQKSAPGATANVEDGLVACDICGRRFNSDRVGRHQQICSKTTTKKRKQFDATIHRVKGTELEPFVKKGGTRKSQVDRKAQKPEVKSNWRRKHEDFINAIRSAKQVQAHLAAGGKLSDLPPPPPSDTSDYVQCPHCGRKFNQAAAERHIPKCQTMMHNKPNPRAPPKPKR